MQTNPQYSDNPEIDLTQISRMMGRLSDRFAGWIYRCMLFVKRNSIVLILLLIIGLVAGYFMDREKIAYNQDIIVKPNFKSSDYLYAKIYLLNSKIRENDTVFFKKIGVLQSSKIMSIKIEPIVDVYDFVEDNPQNLEVLKLMADGNDIKKVLVDKNTSKNYKNHLIRIQTKERISHSDFIKPILEYLDESVFYKEIQTISIQNLKTKIAQNDITIAQIDGILNSYSIAGPNKASDKLMYYNENTQLSEVLKNKENLVKENGKAKIELLSSDKIIKENSSTLNQKDNTRIYRERIIILPLVLISIFLLACYSIAFYKRQRVKFEDRLL